MHPTPGLDTQGYSRKPLPSISTKAHSKSVVGIGRGWGRTRQDHPAHRPRKTRPGAPPAYICEQERWAKVNEQRAPLVGLGPARGPKARTCCSAQAHRARKQGPEECSDVLIETTGGLVFAYFESTYILFFPSTPIHLHDRSIHPSISLSTPPKLNVERRPQELVEVRDDDDAREEVEGDAEADGEGERGEGLLEDAQQHQRPAQPLPSSCGGLV